MFIASSYSRWAREIFPKMPQEVLDYYIDELGKLYPNTTKHDPPVNYFNGKKEWCFPFWDLDTTLFNVEHFESFAEKLEDEIAELYGDEVFWNME